MFLPDELQHRRFTDWNYLVRGLMEVWELAHLTGQEETLEERLRNDRDGTLTERLARIGNEEMTRAAVYRLYGRVPDGPSVLRKALGDSKPVPIVASAGRREQ